MYVCIHSFVQDKHMSACSARTLSVDTADKLLNSKGKPETVSAHHDSTTTTTSRAVALDPLHH